MRCLRRKAPQTRKITATGASFTLDEPTDLGGDLAVTTTAPNAAITIANPVIATTVNLTATSNIAFNADVTVTGGGASSITTGVSSRCSIGSGDSIAFTAGEGLRAPHSRSTVHHIR